MFVSSRELDFGNWSQCLFSEFHSSVTDRIESSEIGGNWARRSPRVVNSERDFRARSHSWVVYRFIALDSSFNFGFEIVFRDYLFKNVREFKFWLINSEFSVCMIFRIIHLRLVKFSNSWTDSQWIPIMNLKLVSFSRIID